MDRVFLSPRLVSEEWDAVYKSEREVELETLIVSRIGEHD